MKFVFEAKASDYDLAAEQEILLRHVSNRKAKWIAAAALCAARLYWSAVRPASENPRCCSRYAASWAASTLYSTFPARNPNVR